MTAQKTEVLSLWKSLFMTILIFHSSKILITEKPARLLQECFKRKGSIDFLPIWIKRLRLKKLISFFLFLRAKNMMLPSALEILHEKVHHRSVFSFHKALLFYENT